MTGNQVIRLVESGLVEGGREGSWLPGGRQDLGPGSRAGRGVTWRWLGGVSCWLPGGR